MALYKGLAPALLTTCVTSGLRFGVQHYFNAWLSERLGYAQQEALPPQIRVLAEGGGGAACGAVLPFIFTPMELIKVKRQVLQDNAITNLEIARRVWREHGLRGLYTGHTLTVARSTLGNTALFGSYEAWQALLLVGAGRGERSSSSSSSASLNMAAGVLSGWTTAFVIFPLDSAKSRLQAAQGSATGGGGGSLLSTLAQLSREGSMYRGVGATLARAVPVHMVYMPAYSLVLAAVSSPEQRTSLRRRRSTAC